MEAAKLIPRFCSKHHHLKYISAYQIYQIYFRAPLYDRKGRHSRHLDVQEIEARRWPFPCYCGRCSPLFCFACFWNQYFEDATRKFHWVIRQRHQQMLQVDVGSNQRAVAAWFPVGLSSCQKIVNTFFACTFPFCLKVETREILKDADERTNARALVAL